MDMFPFIFRRRTGENKACDMLSVVVLKVRVKDDALLHFFIDAETFLVDWGDGVSDYETWHCYPQSGEYVVRIVGTAMNGLDVSRCRVFALDVSKCAWLERLNCSGNRLETLDVSACRWLMELDCSRNSLKNLTLGGLPFLRALDCRMNVLKELELSECRELLCLHGSGNNIHKLDMMNCPDIRCVDIGGNCFTTGELNGCFKSLPSVPQGQEGRIMCDLNKGYNRESDFSLLGSKGWNLV